MSDIPAIVRHLTAERADQQYRASEIDLLWRQVIRNAVNDGESVTEIAEAAGISRARVYQIRDGRR